MSLGVVQKILGRMVAEREFRILVFTDPDKALAGYDLTEAEIKTLKGLSREKFDAAAANLDERVSMSPMASSLDDVQQTVKKAGAQPDDAVEMTKSKFDCMQADDQRFSLTAQIAQQVHHLTAALGVYAGYRFIRQDYIRVLNQYPGDCHPLLLPSRKARCPHIQFFGYAHLC